MHIQVDELDLAELATRLRQELPPGEPVGYLRGKQVFRELLYRLLGCSYLEAEELVDTLELRGYLQFEGDTSERAQAFAHWRIQPAVEL